MFRQTISTMLCAGACVALAASTFASSAQAQRRGGAHDLSASNRAGRGQGQAHQVRSQATSNLNNNANRNVNRNINQNINRDLNVDVDVHHDYDWGNDWNDHYHPVAIAATAAVTTAIIMGSYYRTLPPNCVTIYRGAVVYYQCGTYWYQPIYSGSSVQYQVVPAP